MRSNHSIERMSNRLRRSATAHVKRQMKRLASHIVNKRTGS
jgi:ribosomal protein S21